MLTKQQKRSVERERERERGGTREGSYLLDILRENQKLVGSDDGKVGKEH